MRMPHITHLLSSISQAARADRAKFVPPPSYFNQITDTYAEIWFPTGGCMWDSFGHCTTCNYGAPMPVAPDAMVQAVEHAVARLAPTTQTLWVSAFDTLQEREVPAEARRRIFDLLAATPASTFITETHPASVRASRVAECVSQIQGRTLCIELGVETMDEFVRYACVNKPFTNSTLERAVRDIHESGAMAWANLLVGIPFLSTTEVIDYSIKSVCAAIKLGFDRVVLFPNHVKEHTIAHLMAAAGRYTPPDLWVMRDVLAGVPHELIDKVNLAWVDIKPHPGVAKVEFAPDPEATATLHELLNKFDLYFDRDALREAIALPGPRRDAQLPSSSLAERLICEYQWLAVHHGERGWWEEHATAVAAELEAALDRNPAQTLPV